ncbi:uncharacterized protein LOC114518668 [Dendronephthya gigantea]|uniref:uncharacterized protein LOC114518668 n=1 Tax=Dendronephthya gigantea TaxID=151771 RepID=UPI00106A4B93|nr:uncharacterized protein LOC114518668 [Dendronephthya gigantea]
MPNRCIVGGCSNTSNAEKGISLHFIPFSGDERPEAKKRRKQWIDFVRSKRAKWDPTPNSSICSAHFDRKDFTQMFSGFSGKVPRLASDEIGVVAVPKYHTVTTETVVKPSSARARRMVVKEALSGSVTAQGKAPDETCHETDPAEHAMENVGEELPENTSPNKTNSVSTGTDGCVGCAYLLKEKRKTWNKYIALKSKYDALVKVKHSKGVQCNILNVEELSRAEMLLTLPEPEPGSEETGDDMDTSDEDFQCGDESESDKSELGDEDTSNPTENLRQQPKYIIFLSQLLLLFKFCHYCKADDPLVETTTDGTLLIVRTTCANPVCSRKNNIWRSQPLMPTTKLNACDFLLSFAILVSGGSPTKVLNMFRHMGLVGMCNESYYRHQGKMLFPTIFLHWEDYRRKILDRLQALESLVISGDGRHDSMGHSAKYGAYTIFCCTSAEIIDFSLIQLKAWTFPPLSQTDIKQ